MCFVGGLAGGLNGTLLCGDTRGCGQPFVGGCQVGNLSALVDKPFEVLAVLLDNLVLDVLILLRPFLGGFEFANKSIDVSHLLVQFLGESGCGVPRLAHLLGIFRSAVNQRLYNQHHGGNDGKEQSERICLDNSVQQLHCVGGRTHTLSKGNDGYTSQYNGGAVCRHNGFADTEDCVPGHGCYLDEKNPRIICGDDGNGTCDSLAVCHDKINKDIEDAEESRR